MDPYFTIIIPSYNRASMLSKAIDSVISQQFINWELIIVDDASTDNTEEIVKSYNNSKIRYIRNDKNIERSASRNKGIENALGKYICFLDSDDYYLDNHLSSFFSIILEKNEEEAIYYCNTLEENNGVLQKVNLEINEKLNNNIERVLIAPIGSPRVCINKTILDIYKYDESLNLGEDIELWVRILPHYPLIYNNDYTVVFLSHNERSVALNNKKGFIEHIRLLKKIKREDRENLISRRFYKKLLSNAYFNLGRHYKYSNERFKTITTMLSALLISPFHRWKEKIYYILSVKN